MDEHESLNHSKWECKSHSSPHFRRDIIESTGHRGDSGKNRTDAGGGTCPLQVRQGRRAKQQIFRPQQPVRRMPMVIREQRFSFNQVRQVLGGVLEHDLHAKRVDSLCDATLGVLRSASLAVCAIGQGLAAARGLNPKHATKQVDRLLSNPKINVDEILSRWVPYVIGGRTSIVAALD